MKMKTVQSNTLAAAVAAVLTTGLVGSPQGWAAAFSVGTDQLGDVLLFPYYTVRDDANGNPLITSFTVTNTDEEHALVLKFRLRDHVDSQDVLDFIWIMSPGDEVVAYMDRVPAGQPNAGQPRVNFPADELTCRVPWQDGAASFTAPGGTVSVEDAQEGHLEIIPMGSLTTDSDSWGSLAVHGSGQDCETLSDLFLSKPGRQNALDNPIVEALESKNGDIEASTVGNVGNVLRGAYTITAGQSGLAGGGSALAIADWDDTAAHIDLIFGQNPLAAQSTQLDGGDTQQWDHPHLGDQASTQYLDDTQTIAATGVINNWSVNPSNGVGIDWVITYFTKYLWRDTKGFYGDAGVYDWPSDTYLDATGLASVTTSYDPTDAAGTYGTPVTNTPWTQAVGTPVAATEPDANGGKCIRISLDIGEQTVIYDREEDTAGVTGGVSPGPQAATADLCNEANVVSFSNGTRKPVLRDEGAVVLDVSQLNLPYGWANVEVNPTLSTINSQVPVAVGGFSYTLRDRGTPGTNYGSIVEHVLDRSVPPPI